MDHTETERKRDLKKKNPSLHSKQIYIVMNFHIARWGSFADIERRDRMKLIMRRCFRHRSAGTRDLRCKFAVHSIRESPNKPNTNFHFLEFRLRLTGNEEISQLPNYVGKQASRANRKISRGWKKKFAIRLHPGALAKRRNINFDRNRSFLPRRFILSSLIRAAEYFVFISAVYSVIERTIKLFDIANNYF